MESTLCTKTGMDLMLNVFALGHRKEFEATQPEILRSIYSNLKQRRET